MREEITELRKHMKEAGMDAYYVPYGDFHCSEYVSDYFKVTEFLSGFTGESATLVVSMDGAHLWTDGRFFIQAGIQLAGSGIEMMKIGEEGVPTPETFIAALAAKKNAKSGEVFVLGFDGKTVPASFKSRLDKALNEEGTEIGMISDSDLAGMVWKDRPAIEPGRIWELPLSSAGAGADSKLASVREMMAAEGADYLLITGLAETAWLFNLRGSDILYTPVFFSFTLVTADSVCLYVMDKDFSVSPDGDLSFLTIKAYDQIYEDIKAIGGGTLWLDSRSCNFGLRNSIGSDVKVIDRLTPPAQMKLVKNETEIACSKRAHIRDGAAVTSLIKWFKDAVKDGKQNLTELDISGKLHQLRAEQEGFIEESFETISAYGSNAAIVHYAPNEETDAVIRSEGFLLLDSGGQYVDGTTDITRTIAAGPLSREMIEAYTYTLKAHLTMAMFEVKDGLNGKDVDDAARKPLQDQGMDFNHGLSHGVGHVLGVHETPNAVSKKQPETELRAGMIMSDEPGVYIEGSFGVRIENLVLWKETDSGTLVNEALTCVPYERDAIDKDLLTEDEISRIDSYHAWVMKTLAPLLDKETSEYLSTLTAPL